MMYLSLRQLLSRKKQSALILLGITMGTAAYVAISGMMIGFQSYMLDQLVNNEAHIRISAREDILTAQEMSAYAEALHVFWLVPPSGRKDSSRIQYPLGWFELFNQDPEVEAYSPQVVTQVLYTQNKISRVGKLIGSQYEKQTQVTNIEKYMKQGQFKDIGHAGNRLIVGSKLLELLGAQVGGTLLVSSGESAPQAFKIVGTFETGIKGIDEGTSFTSLTDAQKLRNSPSEITDIAVKLFKAEKSQTKAWEWKSKSPDKIQSWQESSAAILSVFKTQDIVRNSMTFSIIIVAGFGIYNILSILVNQKRRDIAILRSMGFSPQDVVKLFFNQGVILGILGGLFGLAVGYVICLIMSQVEVVPGRMSGPGNRMIISFDLMIYIKSFFLAFVTAVVSSIIPARSGGKLEPMEIIRSGGQ
jgi:lipoprotein-releasing system permease protein